MQVKQEGQQHVASRPAQPPSAVGKPRSVLLSAAQAAREVFGCSERRFHTMRHEAWMPRPVLVGTRTVRWVRAELEAAVVNMPRQNEVPPQPAQLRRRRIESLKRGA